MKPKRASLPVRPSIDQTYPGLAHERRKRPFRAYLFGLVGVLATCWIPFWLYRKLRRFLSPWAATKEAVRAHFTMAFNAFAYVIEGKRPPTGGN